MEKYNYEGEKILSKLYNDMHLKPSVIHSSNVSDKKYEKIRKYLERQERVHKRALNHRKLDLLKEFYYKKYVIKEVPDDYIKYLDKNQFNQTGHHLTEEQIEERKRLIIEEQKKSLSNWIDYLISDDAKFYPWWVKYWAFQGMLKIGAYDNKNDTYGKRDNKTVAPFVELNRESLAKAIDLVMKEVKEEEIDELDNLIKQGSFTKLYQLLLKNQRKIKYDNKNIEGEWVKYSQGNNYKALWESLQGYNTGWCTAGESTCESQIKNGDFYVYYTKDENGEMKIPRIAIRMDGKTKIGEIRGVAKNQNIEPHLTKVLEDKLKDFPDAKDYQKKLFDSEKLTYVYTKYEYNKELTIEDLKFIYEIDKKLEKFGYEEDPRLSEIKENRNKRKDFANIFDCEEEEIGLTKTDLYNGKKLKYYYGNLDLRELKTLKIYELPEIIQGDLNLSLLENIENVTFPKKVKGTLILSKLKTVKDLKFPDEIETLRLDSLKTAEGIELPNSIKYLDLGNLKTAEGLKLPEKLTHLNAYSLESAKGISFPKGLIGLNLIGLKNAKGLNLPSSVKSLSLGIETAENLELPESIVELDFCNLTNTKGLKLPNNIEYLDLSKIKTAKGLKLPESLKHLYLSSLETIEGLELPEKLEELDLDGLKNAKGLKIPNTIEILNLNNLESTEGLRLPETIREKIILPEEILKQLENQTESQKKR